MPAQVLLDPDHEKTAARRAHGLGLTLEQYLARLIEHDIDDLQDGVDSFALAVAPLTQALRGASEDELDALVEEARDAHFDEVQRETAGCDGASE